MEDLIKSIKAHLYDRATSPLFSTFALSWLAWNYQFALVLFSSFHVDEKLDYISTFLYPCLYSYLLKGFMFPLLTATFFIFAYPYPAKIVYTFTRRNQNQLRKIKQEIEEETQLTVKESRIIRKEMVNLEKKYESELEDKDSVIKQLKEVINDLSNKSDTDENIGKTSKASTLKQPLSLQQLALLKLISDHSRPLLKDLILWSSTEKVVTEYDLGELHKMKFIDDHYPAGGKAYSITHEGRKAIIDGEMIDESEK